MNKLIYITVYRHARIYFLAFSLKSMISHTFFSIFNLKNFISSPLGLLGTACELSDLVRDFAVKEVSSLYETELQELSFSGKDQIPEKVQSKYRDLLQSIKC